MPEIGETLREARMRARIDVSEIEAQTKIRAKYLRALENEEWDLLPGPTFVKSFLRTYAEALDLDGKALVEEYRRSAEPVGEPLEPITAGQRRATKARQSGDGPSRGYLALVGIVLVVIVLLIVGLVSSGGKSSKDSTHSSTSTVARGSSAHKRSSHRTGASSAAGVSRTISVELHASGSVYVCLIGDGGHRLISGKTLAAGDATSVYKGRRFELTLGNNAVTLLIDGTPRAVPASSRAIGYVITKSGRKTLAPGHLPTCT